MDYFDWLCMIAIPNGYQRSRYSKVLMLLMDTPFHWTIPKDENRARDGLELRDIYTEETGEGCRHGGPCSFLEMLVALAIRCNDELMYDPEDPKRADRWFWLIFQRLGMDVFEDKNFQKQTPNEILAILDGFVDKNVKMCPFLFPKPPHNFEKMEIWYQLNHYITWRFWGVFDQK